MLIWTGVLHERWLNKQAIKQDICARMIYGKYYPAAKQLQSARQASSAETTPLQALQLPPQSTPVSS